MLLEQPRLIESTISFFTISTSELNVSKFQTKCQQKIAWNGRKEQCFPQETIFTPRQLKVRRSRKEQPTQQSGNREGGNHHISQIPQLRRGKPPQSQDGQKFWESRPNRKSAWAARRQASEEERKVVICIICASTAETTTTTFSVNFSGSWNPGPVSRCFL